MGVFVGCVFGVCLWGVFVRCVCRCGGVCGVCLWDVFVGCVCGKCEWVCLWGV